MGQSPKNWARICNEGDGMSLQLVILLVDLNTFKQDGYVQKMKF